MVSFSFVIFSSLAFFSGLTQAELVEAGGLLDRKACYRFSDKDP
jgi:hypothetical protein